MMTKISVQHQDFDLNQEYQSLLSSEASCGAVVLFSGLVRDLLPPQQLLDLTLEHYPGMTEKALHTLVGDAEARWDLLQVTLIHRVGTLSPCEQIVLVGVSSAHRTDAFEAAQFLMDQLKTRAPFWKKERFFNSENIQNIIEAQPQCKAHETIQTRWVATKDSDEQLAQRW